MSKTIRILSLPLLAGMLSACFHNDDGGSGGVMTGRLTAAGVEGLHYETQSLSGTTGEDGEFRYRADETVTFSLGNIVLAKDVPAKEFLTPMEFTEKGRVALQQSSSTTFGLSSHRPAEDYVVNNRPVTRNTTRLLMLLDQDQVAGDQNNIRITERTIDQLNDALQTLGIEQIDFTMTDQAFESIEPPSVIEQLLEKICFFQPEDYRCGDIPTEQEIEEARLKQDEAKAEELQTKRDNILNSRRNPTAINATKAEGFLQQDSLRIDAQLARPFYLSPEKITMEAGKPGPYTVKLLSVDHQTVNNLEAISLTPSVLEIESYSAATNSVSFSVIGNSGQTGELMVNFQPEGTYRWFQKSLRVVLN
ncbi:hypothetical protein QQM79_00885 [Marinobacteraceae bacterium S3BR75-40.1]